MKRYFDITLNSQRNYLGLDGIINYIVLGYKGRELPYDTTSESFVTFLEHPVAQLLGGRLLASLSCHTFIRALVNSLIMSLVCRGDGLILGRRFSKHAYRAWLAIHCQLLCE